MAVDYHGALELAGWEDRISLNRLTKAGFKVWILSFASQRWRKREVLNKIERLKYLGLCHYGTVTSARRAAREDPVALEEGLPGALR